MCDIFHPNVYADGAICMDVMKNLWKPVKNNNLPYFTLDGGKSWSEQMTLRFPQFRMYLRGLGAVLCFRPCTKIFLASTFLHIQVFTVGMILSSIQSLLSDPNPASPANNDAAALLTSDPKAYRRRVRRCAENSLEAGFDD